MPDPAAPGHRDGWCARPLPISAVAVRLNATDGIPHPYGFGVAGGETPIPDLSEPLRLRELLIEAGCVLFNITAGIPYYTPHVGRPYDRPAEEAGTARTFIRCAASAPCSNGRPGFSRCHPSSPVVGTGYSWLRHFWPNVGAAVIARRHGVVDRARARRLRLSGCSARPDGPGAARSGEMLHRVLLLQ